MSEELKAGKRGIRTWALLLVVVTLLALVIGGIVMFKLKKARAREVFMFMAIEMNDIVAVQTLVDGGFDVNQELDRYGNRPLHRVADRCGHEIADYLLKKGPIRKRRMTPAKRHT